MTREQVQAALAAAHARAVSLYLRRQDVQAQIQSWQQQAVQVDRELVRSDGEIAALEAVLALPNEEP